MTSNAVQLSQNLSTATDPHYPLSTQILQNIPLLKSFAKISGQLYSPAHIENWMHKVKFQINHKYRN